MRVSLVKLRPYLSNEEVNTLLNFRKEELLPLNTKAERGILVLATKGYIPLRGLYSLFKYSEFDSGLIIGFIKGCEIMKDFSIERRMEVLDMILDKVQK